MLRYRFLLRLILPCLFPHLFLSQGKQALLSSQPSLPAISLLGAGRSSVPTASIPHPVQGSSSNSALIISTVDGVIYTLDAFNGNLRGMVQSGGSLVSHPSDVTNANSSYGDDNFSNGRHKRNHKTSNVYEVIPGLDGSLYSYSVSEQLHQLPVTIQDIIDHGPISTCIDSERDDGHEMCGLVMGQSSSKLIALDPLHGTVQWMHQTNVNNNFSGTQSKTKTVLLQREDYDIKHIDAETGLEGWRVHLGAVKALDLPKKESRESKPNQALFRIRPGVDIDRRNKRRNDGAHEMPLLFEQPFPSVAFGSDGLTLHAMDDMQNTLWVKRFESTIASVYGVGENMNWVHLEVREIDEEEEKENKDDVEYSKEQHGFGLLGAKEGDYSDSDLEKQHAIVLVSAPADSSTGISKILTSIPLVRSQNEGLLLLPSSDDHDGYCDNEDQAFLGQHHSSLFVASKGRKNNQQSDNYDPRPEYYDDEDDEDYVDDDEDDEDRLVITKKNIPLLMDWLGKNQELNIKTTHKTPYGLFLTWKMVASLVVCILFGLAGGRFLYLRKKRHWIIQNSPNLVPFSPASNPNQFGTGKYEDLVPILQLERAKTADSPLLKGIPSASPVTRSMSLSDIDFFSKESRALKEESRIFSLGHSNDYMNNERYARSLMHTKTTIEGKEEDSFIYSQGLKQHHNANIDGSTIAETATFKSPLTNTGRSVASTSMETVSNFEGIPLVRYSRYSSEFNEMSPLGKGGFGTVFKCTNALDGREYAVKKVLIRSHLDANGCLPAKFAQKLEKVLREVKILALLDHANIVRYYTAWLEVEEEEEGHSDQISPNGIPSKSTVCKALSSDFLAGTSTFDDASNSAFFDHSTSLARKRYQDGEDKNPFGRNTFGTNFDELSFDSISTKRKGRHLKSVSSSSSKSEDDLGFTFERAAVGSSRALSRNAASGSYRESLATIHDSDAIDNDLSSSSSSGDSSSTSSGSVSDSSVQWSAVKDDETINSCTLGEGHAVVSLKDPSMANSDKQTATRYQRHILYIQMQLSQKTLLDYFQARDDNIDIPLSLRMFGHIVRGVKNVHEKGLIHRDLKPSNCFMDDSDVVKIGDFGLSRESGAQSGDDDEIEIKTTNAGYHPDNTAGVGTSSYASPEQMKGSDYDSSSDMYSLGIILFELCYPMHTGMERMYVFEGIRRKSFVFPEKWHLTVETEFPSVHSLLVHMLSHDSKRRPSAANVVADIESLLSEYTVLSLDPSSMMDGLIFLRVEADDTEGALARTVKIIKDLTPMINIHQYGLRAKGSIRIMEFALSVASDVADDEVHLDEHLKCLFQKLEAVDEIKNVRQIKDTLDLSNNRRNNAINKN